MGAICLASHSSDSGIFVVFMIFVGVVALLVGSAKKSERIATLEAATRRFGGTVLSSFWAIPRAEFVVDGVAAELTYRAGSKGSEGFTCLRFRHAPAHSLRIVPEGFLQSLGKVFGTQDIELGAPKFDGSFVVQGSPEPWVRQLLDPGTRRRISALSTLGESWWGTSDFLLEASPEGISVRCGRNLVDDPRALDAFLDHSVAILRRIRPSRQEGIQFLSADEVLGSRCPVCANPLGGQILRCADCGTPHHPDCWDYFGGCAIYGCARRGGRAA